MENTSSLEISDNFYTAFKAFAPVRSTFDCENTFGTQSPENVLQLKEGEGISTEETSSKNLHSLSEEPPQKKLRAPLFKLRDKNKPLYPWIEEEKTRKRNPPNNKNVRPMTEYEELELLNHLKSKIRNCEKYPHILRLYRKLVVRKEKRERGLPLFDIDRFPNTPQDNLNYSSSRRNVDQRSRILDRFLTGKRTFPLRIVETVEPREFVSPYTQRILKPFIRRDTETMPPWLKLMYQLLARAHRNVPDWRPPFRFPIDYCYLRPHHVPAVNSLLCEFFYPGIDVTECLEYPDFTCVCLYKKLVIGFACMVPDTGYNEAYISFIVTRPEWRRSKIGTFMIYHLIQTCLGKDITLHVSATNSAMILYQQFGFKSEEFIKDFYDKYLPIHSRDCRHAFFLRLPR